MKKEKEKQENKLEQLTHHEVVSEDEEIHSNKIQALINSLTKRLKVENNSKLNHVLSLSSL